MAYGQYLKKRGQYEYARLFNEKSKRFWSVLSVPALLGGVAGYHVNDLEPKYLADKTVMQPDARTDTDQRIEALRQSKADYDLARRAVYQAEFDGGIPSYDLEDRLHEAEQNYTHRLNMTADRLISSPAMTETALKGYMQQLEQIGVEYTRDNNNKYINPNALQECQKDAPKTMDRRADDIRGCMINANKAESHPAMRGILAVFMGLAFTVFGGGYWMVLAETQSKKLGAHRQKPKLQHFMKSRN